MTKKQFAAKIETARKYGRATLDDCILFYFGDFWSLREFNGQTIDTCTHSPEKYFDYVVD